MWNMRSLMRPFDGGAWVAAGSRRGRWGRGCLCIGGVTVFAVTVVAQRYQQGAVRVGGLCDGTGVRMMVVAALPPGSSLRLSGWASGLVRTAHSVVHFVRGR